MAFGFGFNKAKVLNSAEKHVQQGKIQNAINDYEKVLQHDPKDLAILNTLGDLYARVGNPERAASYFRKVGEAYAADGFTVKAIALYKKITKINPAGVEDIRRLAELYTQQNLLSDARQQYLLVAENYTKTNRLDAAIEIFQKMLEFDPDNVAMQTRLAELYVRMGKKDEAQGIFFRSAQSLHKRGSLEGADEALTRVLTLSPGDANALLMRAQIAVESGNHAAAVRYLESIANIDSNREGLACLLRARLSQGQGEEAEPIARKLLVVHDELSGINQYAEWLAAQGQFEAALRIYAEYSDRLLASNPEPLLQALRTFTERVKENADALELVLGLLQRAGEQSQITEVIELLAHALVQRGEFARARDYYRDLTILEPQNPVHEQNYRQMLARLGEDSVIRSLSPQEGGRAFMADELESSTTEVERALDPQASNVVEAALTESELLDSYSLHPKAIATLESALAQAPRSVRLHQRLVTAYAHSERFSDAARSCELLVELLEDGGHAAQAKEYKTLAERYRRQAVERGQAVDAETAESRNELFATVHPAQPELCQPTPEEVTNASFSPEFVQAATQSPGIEGVPEFAIESEPYVAPAASGDPGTTVDRLESGEPEQIVVAGSGNAGEIELDISEEWQCALQGSPSQAPAPQADSDGDLELVVEPEEPVSSPVAELLEEIRFYIGQQMWEEAAAVIRKCAGLAPDLPELAGLQQEMESVLASSQPELPAEVAVSELALPEDALSSEEPLPLEVICGSEPLPPLADPVLASGSLPGEAPLTVAAEAATPPAANGNAFDNLVAEIADAIPYDLAPMSAEQGALGPPPPMPTAAVNGSMPAPHAQSHGLDLPEPVPATPDALSQLFAEFKEEAEQGAGKEEDPESHYNLGVAFREMGLLDEAIGELQKVARSIEVRRSFRHTLQVYTLLGQCFLEKGVPEAAVRWYEKALSTAPDSEARVAVHYELGSAHEAAGSRPAALQHFLEVYGANIDYRDVAERIRVLKS